MDSKADQIRLVQSCIQQRPFAWQQFVDAYLPVVLQTVHEIDVQTSTSWTETQHHEFARTVFHQLRDNEFEVLRNWDSGADSRNNDDKHSDFTTYLVIATRRIVLNLLPNQGKKATNN